MGERGRELGESTPCPPPHLWNVLYKVSSKQNDRLVTQAQLTKSLVIIVYWNVLTVWYLTLFVSDWLK